MGLFLGAGLIVGSVLFNAPSSDSVKTTYGILRNKANLINPNFSSLPKKTQGRTLRSLHRTASMIESKMNRTASTKGSTLNVFNRFYNWISAKEYSVNEWQRLQTKFTGATTTQPQRFSHLPSYVDRAKRQANSARRHVALTKWGAEGATLLQKSRATSIMRRSAGALAGVVGFSMIIGSLIGGTNKRRDR